MFICSIYVDIDVRIGISMLEVLLVFIFAIIYMIKLHDASTSIRVSMGTVLQVT